MLKLNGLYPQKTIRSLARAFLATRLSVIIFIFLLGYPLRGAESTDPILKYANLLFSEKNFHEAAKQYQLFLKQNPEPDAHQSSLFMLGESFRESGQIKSARRTFQELIQKFRKGSDVGNAAYRLGVLDFNEKNYATALVSFELASREAGSPKVKYQAKYYNARSLQFLQKTDLALKLYDQLIRHDLGPATIHFHEKSRLESARLLEQNGETDAAIVHYDILRKNATIPSIRDEAIVRGAITAILSGEIDSGEAILREATFKKGTKWSFASQIGALFAAYERNDHEKVISIYNADAIISNAGEYRDRVLFKVADSYRRVGNPKAAARLYTLVEGSYGEAATGIEAGYRRLIMLYKANNGALPVEIKKYTDRIRTGTPDSPFIDRANLLLAEWYFFQAEKSNANGIESRAEKQYIKAAEAYGWIREDYIDTRLLPTCWFHQSWSFLEVGDVINGGQIVSKILEFYPDSAYAPTALAKRAEALMMVQEFRSARADYETILEIYPESNEVEIALERMGRIDAHRRNLPEMIQSYSRLIETFPQTSGAGEANFWIGIGYYEQEEYKEAIPYFLEAKRLDSDSFSNKAGIRLIFCYYFTNQIEKLVKASHIYIQSGRDAGSLNERQKEDRQIDIPDDVLAGIGKKLVDQKEHNEALYFYNLSIDPQNPGKTSAKVWKELGVLRFKLKKYQEAVSAFDQLVTRAKNHNERGFGYLSRGQAQLALKQHSKARQSARECLRVVRKGRINADARLLLGDILVAEDETELALIEYQVVAQLFDDHNITPKAQKKVEEAKRNLGNQ